MPDIEFIHKDFMEVPAQFIRHLAPSVVWTTAPVDLKFTRKWATAALDSSSACQLIGYRNDHFRSSLSKLEQVPRSNFSQKLTMQAREARYHMLTVKLGVSNGEKQLVMANIAHDVVRAVM